MNSVRRTCQPREDQNSRIPEVDGGGGWGRPAHYGQEEMQSCKMYEYLGIVMQPSMTLSVHIEKIRVKFTQPLDA